MQALLPDVTIILLTAYGTISQAVEAMRLGAFDYLEKPVGLQQLRAMVERAWQMKQAQAEVLENLTHREREVTQLLAEGKTENCPERKSCAGTTHTSLCTVSSRSLNRLFGTMQLIYSSASIPLKKQIRTLKRSNR